MKNLRNEKGITLVALVVTIIVLLILAGVSLSLVAGGNGIIDKAVTASDRTIEGSAREQTELLLAELVADYFEDKYVNANTALTTQLAYIESRTGSAGLPAGDYTVKVTDGNLTVTTTKNGNTKNVATGTVDSKGKVLTFEYVGKTETPATPSTP